jgi:CRP/FNR family cyclic AMP-dependent transcriptional regulator
MNPAFAPFDEEVDGNKVWYLTRNRFFANAMDGGIDKSAHIFTIVGYPRRTLIFDQGDPSRTVFFVKRGTVRIARVTSEAKEVTVAVLGPGDMFGEESLFGTGERATVAVAVDSVLLCTVRADDLFSLIQSEPMLALNVAKILQERLADAAVQMEDIAYARVSDRLMHLFRRLAGEHGAPVPGGVRIETRFTHADLATLIGSTRETVSLEMSQLVRTGAIRLDGRQIIVPLAELNK